MSEGVMDDDTVVNRDDEVEVKTAVVLVTSTVVDNMELSLQQSFLAPVWLFFKRNLAKLTFSSCLRYS